MPPHPPCTAGEAFAQLLRMTPDQLKRASSDEEAREFAAKWREAFSDNFVIRVPARLRFRRDHQKIGPSFFSTLALVVRLHCCVFFCNSIPLTPHEAQAVFKKLTKNTLDTRVCTFWVPPSRNRQRQRLFDLQRE